jgi:hypothetical protein
MLIDDFKGDLKAQLRIVYRYMPTNNYRFVAWDNVSDTVVIGDTDRNTLLHCDINMCLVPVGTDRAMNLRQALTLINEIGECSDAGDV